MAITIRFVPTIMGFFIIAIGMFAVVFIKMPEDIIVESTHLFIIALPLSICLCILFISAFFICEFNRKFYSFAGIAICMMLEAFTLGALYVPKSAVFIIFVVIALIVYFFVAMMILSLVMKERKSNG